MGAKRNSDGTLDERVFCPYIYDDTCVDDPVLHTTKKRRRKKILFNIAVNNNKKVEEEKKVRREELRVDNLLCLC